MAENGLHRRFSEVHVGGNQESASARTVSARQEDRTGPMIAPKTAFAFAGTLLASALLASSPAAAQDAAQNKGQNEGGERINMVIAYSEDECPEAQDNEIVVCEILVEAER